VLRQSPLVISPPVSLGNHTNTDHVKNTAVQHVFPVTNDNSELPGNNLQCLRAS